MKNEEENNACGSVCELFGIHAMYHVRRVDCPFQTLLVAEK